MMANADRLRSLVIKRGQLKAKLTRFKSYLDAGDNSQLRIRFRDFENLLPAFDDIQSQIETLDDSQEEQDAERETFEDIFYQLASRAEAMLSSQPSRSSSPDSSNLLPTVGPTVKLPAINLPKFTGNYEDWLPFHDLFYSLIHNNTTLTDVEKFHYLKTSLDDKVKPILSSLEASSDNYATAWSLLKDRYDNKRIIVNKHISSLVNMDPITRENANSIRSLLDNINKHIRCLNSLGQPTDSWDSILIFILSKKLDSFSLRHWENQNASKDLPTIKTFLEFLQNRCQILEAIEHSKHENKGYSHTQSNPKQNHNKGFLADRKEQYTLSHVSTNIRCQLCYNSNHNLYKCPKFLAKSSRERLSIVKQLNLCTNCLSKGHGNSTCVSGSCKICTKKHNTLLHMDSKELSHQPEHTDKYSAHSNKYQSSNQNQNQSDTVLLSAQSNSTIQVLLSTAVVLVKDKYGANQPCKALLDNGSQANFMTNRMVQLLRLKKYDKSIYVKGINEMPSQTTGSVNCTIKSTINNFERHLEFQVVPTITQEMPSTSFDISSWNLPPWIQLADPNVGKRGKIDMLIGGEIFLELLCIGQFIPAPGAPVLQKTLLGWIVGGKMTLTSHSKQNSLCLLTATEKLHNQVKKFWEIEEVGELSSTTSEEKLCEQHYKKTTVRNASGRYVVSLPLKENVNELGDSYAKAVARLQATERKLHKDKNLRSEYDSFLNEYLSLNHMEHVVEDEQTETTKYYLPHLPVIRESSSTTKLRVVFDASAKSSSGLSLNDIMRVGPTIQPDLFSTICSFRSNKYAMTADITKMYRQILISNEQHDLQRILWKFHPNDEISIFRLKTVTYGMAAAPFLAIRTLHQLAEDEGHNFPAASKVLKEDFYVDDMMTGSNDLSEATKLQKEIMELLKRGGFELRKWSANHPQLLQSIPEDKRESHSGNMSDNDQSVKVLGMLWNSNADFFHFSVQKDYIKSVTKRAILSGIAGLFDPLGLLGPVIVTAKILLQKLWSLKLSWDESLPQNMHQAWSRFRVELNKIEKLRIPRQITPNYPSFSTLIGFCDASDSAYGACIYVHEETCIGQIQVTLLCSKSRVAPLKQQTTPRLELCGALLLSRLLAKVKLTKIKYSSCILWSDSSIALAWIRAEPLTWKTFVSNRVQEIKQLTKNCTWKHVNSKDNPADLVSRGIMPAQLIDNKLWWNGPSWLVQPRHTWPDQEEAKIRDIPERRKLGLTATALISQEVHSAAFIDIRDFSTMNRLQRVTAYCLRFIHNCHTQSNKHVGALSTLELQNALHYLIRAEQKNHFYEEIKSLKSNDTSRNSRLKSLQPFIDKNELLRVGGRLENAYVTYDQKHPIILPAKSHLTDLIIRQEHYRSLHSGPQLLLATVRLQYWPLGGRNIIRKIVRQCVHCFKAKPKAIQPKMGDLPRSRLTQSRPFLTTGVDYCGPIYIKAHQLRKAKLVKAYIAVFTCFSTKAMHLELVSDLSTEAFLCAFKRFISRRGICKDIYSDNGTNFVGAYREIQEVRRLMQSKEHKNKIMNDTNQLKINWHFVPPQSPHFGGLWEAGVKSLKHHLRRVVRNANLTFEQLYTVLTMVEACLNSRPLTPISTDSTDPNPLTPGHFLTGEALLALPELDVTPIQSNRLSQWQRVQHITRHFWDRWSKEYLSLLQQRSKWSSESANLQPGQLVVVRDDRLPPLKWITGRVVDVHPGADGRVRVATIKTFSGVYKRAANRLCILPTEHLDGDQ